MLAMYKKIKAFLEAGKLKWINERKCVGLENAYEKIEN